MEKTLKELNDLYLELKNENDYAYLTVRHCVEIMLKDKGGMDKWKKHFKI